MSQRSEARAYFEAHLHDQTDDCMIWPYALTRGYGKVSIDGRPQYVHVLACIEHHGPRPEGMQAAHGPCHNRRCWNGRHVSWKTAAANQADRHRDGTFLAGSALPQARVTEASVVAIRAEYAAGGITQQQLAERYGICRSMIGHIITRRYWAHI